MVSLASPARALVAAARLCAITPDLQPSQVEAVVAAWLRAGVRFVQLRHKSLPRGDLLVLAGRLAAAVGEAGGLLVVNDHVDIALLSGSAGVHLGPDDLTVAAARRVAGAEFLIGASAASPAAARAAEAEGADYLGSGPAFPTANKPEKQVIGPAGIAEVAAAVAIPVFAIGGITPERVPELRRAGVERACAIGALAGPAPGAAAGRLLALLG